MPHLHIVAFNVPWPADYGGVIDVYYRIVGLAKAGVKVHLHCYTYGREMAEPLAKICEEVCYYPRETGWRNQFNRRPYIVASRRSEDLISKLEKDDYPILLEGLHDCYVLERLAETGRKITVRAHNVEHDYYQALAKAEKNAWKRLFYAVESRKLRKYEPVLAKASAILAINSADAAYFKHQGYPIVEVVPPSHGHGVVESLVGKGQYALYHGNLSVAENISAVDYLLENIVDKMDFLFVVAGRNPDDSLKAKVAQHGNVKLVANPSDAEMRDLLREAQVNVLFTNQDTGVKLKLLNALYEGRHCLVNSKMVQGTGLDSLCHVADNLSEQIDLLRELMLKEFGEDSIASRQKMLENVCSFDEIKNIIL